MTCARPFGIAATLAATVLLLALSACGGNGSTSTSLAVANDNTAPLLVDAGLPGIGAINVAYTSVTLCAPGSTTNCQTIDHVMVDTGSTGFRVLASALGGGLAPAQLGAVTDASGNALVECTHFADGYSWGPVKLADLRIGGEAASSVPVQVMGDPTFPSSLIPSTCVNLPNGEEDSIQTFGANGVLGIGNYLQDCGAYCTQAGVQDGSAYNLCSTTIPVICQPANVGLGFQVSNPVAYFPKDNNGVTVLFPPVSTPSANSIAGTLVFGVGTEPNNAVGAASIYTLDPNYGTFYTNVNATTLGQSFIDSGSNAYFFPDSAIADCTGETFFYCPPSTVSLTAQIQGINGNTANIPFAISNADQLPGITVAAPDLGGPAGTNTLQSFDWGMPFFYGRTVFVLFEGSTIAGVTGPAVAF